MIKTRITGATRCATASGKVIASVLGITSPKTRTKTVMTAVATATPLSPKALVNRAVASEADRMFTMLLPSNSAPIIRSLSSVTFIAAAAPDDPLSANCLSLPRDDAVSAVSDPEKKADITKRHRMARAVSQNVVSIKLVSGMGQVTSRFAFGQRMVGQHQRFQLIL